MKMTALTRTIVILILSFTSCSSLVFAQALPTNSLPLTAVWKFTTANLNGAPWPARNYDDSSWASGPALLYVETNSLVTPRNTLLPGTPGTLPATYYFRTHFYFTGNPDDTSLSFSSLIDDGAVFYLNGVEIQRVRMVAGPSPVSFTNLATHTPFTGDAFDRDGFTIAGDLVRTNLLTGDNVIAVEVHQATSTSSDVVFGAALFVRPEPGQPSLTVAEKWVHRYNGAGNGNDYPVAVAVDNSGNVIVTGGSLDETFRYEFYTAKYAAANGALLWEKRFNGGTNETLGGEATALALDSSGNVVIAGWASYLIPNYTEFYTAKYAAASGALLWEKRYHSPDGFQGDRATALALDASGNVLVTGGAYYNHTNSVSQDFYTAKYAASDGALLWERRYAGPNNDGFGSGNLYHDGARAVVVDGSGNVMVTGSSDNGTNADFYTAKYAAANGALIWERRYNGLSDGEDFPAALAVDGSGNAIVTGGSESINGEYEYYTAKYASATGALLWERRSPEWYTKAIAVDGDDNVVVTGDNKTIKYAGATGALLWEIDHYDPTAGVYPEAVAVDGIGNVLVTGADYSYGDTARFTAKYATADGALLWKIRYAGTRATDIGTSEAHRIALGTDGMIAITGQSPGIHNSSTNFDYATVAYREIYPTVSVAKVAAGYRLRFEGIANKTYQVQRASAVTGPWSSNATRVAISNGIIEYLDTNAPAGSAFYRTKSP